MDRQAFFQALPCLAPLHVSSGAEWPPPNGGSSCNVILQDYMLSVEPTAVGPACFVVTDKDQDAAMFSIDLSLIVVSDKPQPLTTSPASSSASTSLSLSQTSKHASQQDGHEPNKSSQTHVVICIDKKLVLQVDLSLLVHVQFHEKADDLQVPHVLLQFDACTFRIFSPEALNNKADASEASSGGTNRTFMVEPLETAASRLKKTLSAFKRVGIVGNYHHLLPMEDCTESPIRGESDKERLTRNVNKNCAILPKKSSLKRSWDALQALQTVLDMPYDTSAAQNDHDDIIDTISPILDTCANQLASSYSRKSLVQDAIQNCTNEIVSCETQLNAVFSAGFPPPTRNRRHASPASKTATAAAATTQEEDTETLIATAHTLLEKQKAAMKERLELFLLPTRG